MMRRARQIVTVVLVLTLCVMALAVWYLALWPEHAFAWLSRRYYTAGTCTVDAIYWRQHGADLHGLRMTARNVTAEVGLAQVRIPRLAGARWMLSATVLTGWIDVSVAPQKPSGEAPPVTKPLTSYLPCVPVQLAASTMTVRVSLPYTTNLLTLDWNAHMWCDRDAPTQALAGIDLAMRAPAGGTLRGTAALAGHQLHVWCAPAVSSFNYVVRYLPVKLPVTVLKGKVCGDVCAVADISAPTAALHAASASLSFQSERIRASAQKTSIYTTECKTVLALSRPVLSTDRPRDPLTYLLARIEGGCTARTTLVTVDAVHISNIAVIASALSGRVDIATASLQAMGGVLEARGTLRRVKVKDKLAWRWLYDLECSLTNADAGQVCALMNLTTNRLEGRFSGRMRLAGFGPRVSHFDGELLSGGGGVFFFPDAAAYLLPGKKATTMHDKIIELNIDRLRQYDYRSTHVGLSYDPETITTIMRFNFDGRTQGDTVKFELHHHGTWLDAFNLGQMFR